MKFRSGEILFKEGEMGDAALIIKSGSIELSRKTHSGW